MASTRAFTTSGDKSSRGGVSLCAGSAEWLPYSTDRLWDLWVCTFAYIERLFGCFLSTLVRVYAAQGGSAPNEGDNVTARLHVLCLGPGNTSFIYSRLATSLRSLAIILLTLPLYYSTVLTSTGATVSTHIHSDEAIHRRMPLQLDSITGRRCGSKWINMYRIVTPANAPESGDMQCLKYFNLYQHPRNHGTISRWISWLGCQCVSVSMRFGR